MRSLVSKRMYKSVFISQIKLTYVSLFEITGVEYQFPCHLMHKAV